MDSDSLLERWFAAGDAGDFDVFDEVLDPDVIIHAPLGLSTHGVDAEKLVWKEALEGIPDIRHEIQDVLVIGSVEAARVVVTGTPARSFGGLPVSGASFTIDQGLFAHVRDGKIVEAWEIVDTENLKRQLGTQASGSV